MDLDKKKYIYVIPKLIYIKIYFIMCKLVNDKNATESAKSRRYYFNFTL